MNIAFDEFVTNHRFTLKCVPKSDGNQEISNLKVDVYPKQFINESSDAFNNICLTGYAPTKHNKFYIDVLGLALTGKKQDIIYEDKYKVGFYKYHTAITKPSDKLKEYFWTFDLKDDLTNFEKAIIMTNRLFQDFIYEQGITDVNTTAEQAFELGKGVCQDYAHILISLCKMAGIPARYVVGLLVGEGYSHAWVEIFEIDKQNTQQGYWIGIDPTNNLIIDDEHIKISCGKDYSDCIINQGVFWGGGKQNQSISVIVYEDHS